MSDRLIHQSWAAFIRIVSPISSSFQKLYAALISLLSGIASFFGKENPPPFFTLKHFAISTCGIFGFLQVDSTAMARSPFQSNPGLYYVAVATFLINVVVSAIEEASSSSSHTYRLPRRATNSLGWCVFSTRSLSFAATASFLFGDSVRPIIFVVILIIISAYALLHWVYESRCGWRRFQLSFKNICKRLASLFSSSAATLPR